MIENIGRECSPAGSLHMQEIFRFRHEVFIERACWDVPSHDRQEFDQFDHGHARYIVWREHGACIRGMLRIIPSSASYMIAELWPELFAGRSLPASRNVWEISRFGIAPDASRGMRSTITSDLVISCLEFGLAVGIERYVAVMPSSLARRVLGSVDWSYTQCGPVRPIGPYRAIAIELPVSRAALARVRAAARGWPHAGAALRISMPARQAPNADRCSRNAASDTVPLHFPDSAHV